MPASKPHAVARAFADPIQKAIGCFADCLVNFDQTSLGSEGVLSVNRGNDVVLPGDRNLSISVVLRYEIVETNSSNRNERYKVRTRGYDFRLNEDDDELCSYHWHPVGVSHVRFPHLHIPNLNKIHLPTGRILVEDVLRLAVDLGSKPRSSDWESVLDLNKTNVAKSATWGLPSAPLIKHL